MSKTETKKPDELLELWQTLQDRNKAFLEGKPPKPILTFEGQPVNIKQGTVSFTGQSKTGKSSLMFHLALLQLCKDYELKHNIDLGLKDKTPFEVLEGTPKDKESYFLFIDPENSIQKAKINYINNVVNSLRYLITDEGIRKDLTAYIKDKLLFVGLRDKIHRSSMHQHEAPPLEYIKMLLLTIELKGYNISGIAIDNFLKLNSENNQKNAEDIFNEIDNLKTDYNLTVYLSLHHNKMNDYATGHFGTAVSKYSETHFKVYKDNKNVHKVQIDETALGEVGKFMNFKFSEEFGCFDFSNNVNGTFDTYINQMQKILSNGKYLSKNQLAIKLKKDGAQISERQLMKHVEQAIKNEYLEYKGRKGAAQLIGLADE